MYNFLINYMAIAIATGITSYITIFRPLIQEIRKQELDHAMGNSPKVACILCIIISTILAPALLFSIFTLNKEEFVTNYVKKLKNNS